MRFFGIKGDVNFLAMLTSTLSFPTFKSLKLLEIDSNFYL